MKRKIRVLFVRPSAASFIQHDLAILSRHFDVKILTVSPEGRTLSAGMRYLLKLKWGVLRSDVAFCWFADIYSKWSVRLARWSLKKSIVVVGGYEVGRVPELNYGPSSAASIRMVRYTLDHADLVLVVDDSLKKEAIENVGANGSNIRTVPTGFDYNKFHPAGEKQNLVLTIGFSKTLERNRLKGIDLFAECARASPDLDFVVIGVEGKALQDLADRKIDNLRLLGPMPQSDLLPYLQKAKVYCQLSMHEGLPTAVCEAMLCECVPVGTRICGIPTAIGDTGFYAEVGDVKTATEAIKKALASNNGAAARERIRTLFPQERREREILQAVQSVVSSLNSL